MKRLIFLSIISIAYLNLHGQDFIKKVAIEICSCIDTIENSDSLDARLNNCAPEALEKILEESSDEIQEAYSTEDAMVDAINKAFEMLLSECPKIRTFIINERIGIYYRMSQSEEANDLYRKGLDLYEKEDYKGALKYYSKSLRKDPEFIYALDNMALTYRKLGDIRKAINSYLRSLKIYPEGSYALLNLGVAYTYNKEYDKALDIYSQLMYFYPDNPEGYYGTGRVFVLMEEYEKAIDFIFIAHKLYTLNDSEYKKDSEELAVTIFNKLKEQDRQEVFIEKAREHGININ